MGKKDDDAKYIAAVGDNTKVTIGAMGDNAKGKVVINHKKDDKPKDVDRPKGRHAK